MVAQNTFIKLLKIFTMVLILNGSPEHGAHIWKKIRYFDLMKAFCYIDRVVKSIFFSSWNRLNLLNTCVTCSELPSFISSMIFTLHFQVIKHSELLYGVYSLFL